MQCADSVVLKRATSKLLASAFAGLLVGMTCAPVMAQGTGKATMSVGITIVAAAPAADRDTSHESTGPRIPVDPAYAVDSTDPLRNARVERVALADGAALQVVSY